MVAPSQGLSAAAASLARRIRGQGPISVADFMAEVLTHPRHGYYTTRDPFGAARPEGGDFTTAPEISQMFGELIGLWCLDCWQRLGSPPEIMLIELGPGRGTLLADALRAARVVPAFRRALRPHLVEVSPLLRGLQKKALGNPEPGKSELGSLAPRWYDSLGQVPDGPALIIANEFFDALPIHQYERSDSGWCERLVGLDTTDSAFAFTLSPPSPLYAALVPEMLRGEPTGSIVEVCQAAAAAAGELGRRLARHGGAALIIDYGHIAPRSGATLQALRQHKAQDVLIGPGQADLTAHVDFSALTAATRASGAEVHGPIPQGRFLKALGISARRDALVAKAPPGQATDIAAAERRLTDAAQMGDLFKVLCLTGPAAAAPAGFA